MKSRRKFTPKFKAQVAIEAIKEHQTIVELSKKYNLHTSQIRDWKRDLTNDSTLVFENGVEKKSQIDDHEKEKEQLFSKIGKLQFELDFLKKALS